MKNNINKTVAFNVHSVIFVIIQTVLLLYCGTYSPGAIVFSGVAASALVMFNSGAVKISRSQGLFALFSLWYFACSLRHGFVTEYAVRGIQPLVVFIFWLYVSSENINRPKIISVMMEVSMWIALASIVHCLVISINASSVRRLVFPFDYSNACGIYFALCYFLSRESESRFIRRIRYIFPVALILSQSVGAVILFTLALVFTFIKQKKFVPVVLLFAVIALFAALFYGRIVQSMGTFVERILQITDGLRCIKANPFFGIGAGHWENAKQLYQSGFYSARVMHSSILSIGVSSGITGLALFLAVLIPELIAIFKKKKTFIPAIILVLHSMLDFSLSFTAIAVMLVLMADVENDKKSFSLKPSVLKASVAVLLVAFLLMFSALSGAGAFQKKLASGADNDDLVKSFNEDFSVKYSVKAAQCLAAKLYSDGDTGAGNIFVNYKYMPTEVILYNAMYLRDTQYLINIFSEQSYNTALRDYIIKNFSEISSDIREISADAVKKASMPGKILYKLKGENL